MTLEIPDQLRRTALADGHDSWLDALPQLVDELAQEWRLRIGRTLPGGHAALVLEATADDGMPAVLKLAVPGREVAREATALRIAEGRGCARLLRSDVDRRALLLERLGRAMHDVVPDPARRHELLAEVAMRLWRPVGPDVDLTSGAELAEQYADRLPVLWEQAGRPCASETIRDALECLDRRRRAHDDASAVLVHGDLHQMNALRSDDGGYRLIDPVGVRGEPACDLGTIVRCDPALGDDLHERTARLAELTAVDAPAIWEWGTAHRVVSGVYACTIGFQPFGRQLLAEADRLVGSS